MLYLYTSRQHTGGHFLVEAGVLLTVIDQVPQLRDHEQAGAMFVHGFDKSLFGAQPTHHNSIVFIQRCKSIQEADELLHDLSGDKEALKYFYYETMIL